MLISVMATGILNRASTICCAKEKGVAAADDGRNPQGSNCKERTQQAVKTAGQMLRHRQVLVIVWVFQFWGACLPYKPASTGPGPGRPTSRHLLTPSASAIARSRKIGH